MIGVLLRFGNPSIINHKLKREPYPDRVRVQFRGFALFKHVGQRVVSPEAHAVIPGTYRPIGFQGNHAVAVRVFLPVLVAVLVLVHDSRHHAESPPLVQPHARVSATPVQNTTHAISNFFNIQNLVYRYDEQV